MRSFNHARTLICAFAMSLAINVACGGGGGGSSAPPPPVAPGITTQPQNQAVLDGATATFTVTASGTAPLSYQWKKGGVSIGAATASTYTTPATTMADSGSSFTVTVSNSAGSITSNAATLTVNPAPPVIITQPGNATVTSGSAATFTVSASGTPPLSYQWSKGGVDIGGATTSSYTTPATVLADNAATFRVTVTNAQGSVPSNAATLTVQEAPAFTTQPLGGTVVAGNPFTFTAATTGNPTPTYQWYKGATLLAGKTASSLTLASATLADAGSYTVVASNSLGSLSSNAAVLVVNQAPIISTHPASQTIVSGNPVTFSVVATGFPALSYQWYKDSVTLAGKTSSSLTLASVAPADAGNYTVDVINGLGTVTSNPAALTVTVPPAISVQPAPQTVTAPATATFSVTASGTPAPTYQWKKNGTNIPSATSSSYTTPATSLANQGESFTVVLTNSAGTLTSDPAILTVQQGPQIGTHPTAQTIVSGNPVTFTVVATGYPALSYQWNKDGSPLAGKTASSLSIASVAPSDAGSYTVDVINTLATVTSNPAVLTVHVSPAITTQPASQTVVAPAAATFSVVATGTPAPTYQWQKNLSDIPSATASSYTTPATALAEDGSSYRVVITNAAGSINSNAAILTVHVAPAITGQPSAQSVVVGQTATFSVTATGNPAPSYQWRKNGLNVASGGTSASYTTPVTILGDDGSTFDVVVSNGIGSPVISVAATLTVAAAPVTPVFLLQPLSQTIAEASSVTFTSNASGTPTPTYQWKKDGATIGGATSSSYTIASVAPADAGAYTVVATNSQGNATSNVATLTVNYKPVITVHPQSQTVNQGADVSFSVAANAVPGISGYQWQYNGADMGGQVASSLTLNGVTPSQNGSYRVVVTNSVGSTTSNAATLTVNPTHSIGGRVSLTNNGTGVSGVTISINTSPVRTTTTDGNGDFTLSGLVDGAYTLTPSITGPSSIFLPASRSVTVAGSDQSNVQFQVMLGYTVSGTVAYAGSKTGRIYLSLDGGNGGGSPGISLAAKGAFTIRGVPPGTYTLYASMDTIGQGVINAANPVGSTSVTVNFANVSGADVTLADPAAINLTGAAGPTIDLAAPYNGGAVLFFSPVVNVQNVETADSYLVEWSSNGFTSVLGSATLPATGTDRPIYFTSGLVDGNTYQFRLKGKAGLTTSNASTVVPVTVGAGAGANTITGTVTFTGTATGPLAVGFFSESSGNIYVKRVTSPVSPQAFSISGVPDGTYFFFGILDQNNNGIIDPGDLTNTGGNSNSTVVIAGATSGLTLTLPNGNAIPNLSTSHQQSTSGGSTWESYGLNFDVAGNRKQPVNVALTLGTAVIDLAKRPERVSYQYWFNLNDQRPSLGDSYSVHVAYTDASSEDLPVAVTAVLDTFARNLAPVTGGSTSLTPTFTWLAPLPAPGFVYTYNLWLQQQGGGQIWSVDNMPSSTLSVLYNNDGRASQPALTAGVTYQWSVSVRDGAGNSTQKSVEYRP